MQLGANISSLAIIEVHKFILTSITVIKLVFAVFYLCFCFISALKVCHRFQSQHKFTALRILNTVTEYDPHSPRRMHWENPKLPLLSLPLVEAGPGSQEHIKRMCNRAPFAPTPFLGKQSKKRMTVALFLSKEKENKTEAPSSIFCRTPCYIYSAFPWLLQKPRRYIDHLFCSSY